MSGLFGARCRGGDPFYGRVISIALEMPLAALGSLLVCFASDVVSLCLLSPASDYGMKLPILRSNPEDQILYQTERYNEETFGYEVPIREEGDYVLVLKFAEVYFAQSQQKVRLGHRHSWLVLSCGPESV